MDRQPGDRRPTRDTGSGTVLVVGAVGLILGLVMGALTVVSAVLASHRAQAAADLGALAAAGVLVRGEPPGAACTVASNVTGRNGGQVTACRAGADLSVEVVVQVQASLARLGPATVRSRAGPGVPTSR